MSNWFSRLSQGLSRTSSRITERIGSILTKRPLDRAMLDELEEVLLSADMGPTATRKIVAEFSKSRFGKEVDEAEVRTNLAEQIEFILSPHAKALDVGINKKPFVIMMVGVNGVGKTTTIGKLAKQYKDQGKKVVVAAGDTFRAAAVAQLSEWAQRADVDIVTAEMGSDAAALAYKALEKAQREQADVLLLDTAGRLHNKTDLMNELSKIARVMKKLDAEAPQATILVLDATTGQNAHAQVDIFKSMTDVTGLVVTKLDGTAKGGVLVSLAEAYRLPIYAIGVGEGVEDLQPFSARDFSRTLVGL